MHSPPRIQKPHTRRKRGILQPCLFVIECPLLVAFYITHVALCRHTTHRSGQQVVLLQPLRRRRHVSSNVPRTLSAPDYPALLRPAIAATPLRVGASRSLALLYHPVGRRARRRRCVLYHGSSLLLGRRPRYDITSPRRRGSRPSMGCKTKYTGVRQHVLDSCIPTVSCLDSRANRAHAA